MATSNEDITVDYGEAPDAESIFGDASQLSLASASDRYHIENNRKYHVYRDGSYWIPHDDEALRLDHYSHHLFLLTLNDKLFLAPLTKPRKVIDIGTGIGIWAQNFADQFPDADVIGTDLSPVQNAYPAPNLRFEVDDCCSEWIYPPDHFDYIHVRLLYGSVADWPAFYKECYDHLAPGGYLEQSEVLPVTASDDGSISEGDPFDIGGKLAIESGQRTGKAMDIQPHIKNMISQAGFVDVVEKLYKWPIGDWPADPRLKEIGIMNARHWMEGIEAWSMRLLTQYQGWTADRVRKWNQDVRSAIRGRRHHAYQTVGVVYARKPS